MRLITLAPTDVVNYDIIALHGEMTFGHGTKRSQRAKLINGDVYFHNAGYTDKDRDCSIKAEVTLENAKDLDIWLRDSVEFIFHDDMGSYIGVLNALSVDGVQADLTVWVKELLGLVSDEIYPVPVPPTPEVWLDMTDDTFYPYALLGGYYPLSWDGTYWDNDEWSTVDLWTVFHGYPINPVFIGFRPTKMRITYTAAEMYIEGLFLYGDGAHEIIRFSPTNIASGDELDLSTADWSDGDLTRIAFVLDGGTTDWRLKISKIEFLQP